MDWRSAVLLVVTVLVAAMLVVAWNRNYRAESEWDQDPQPPVHVNILQAKIWNCSYPPQSVVDKLQTNGHLIAAELLHTRKGSWVELLSDSETLAGLGLERCREVAGLRELVAMEMQGSWRTLQYHISEEYRVESEAAAMASESVEHAVRRDSCTEGGCAHDNTAEDWFTQYHNLSASYQWYTQLAFDFPSVVRLNSSIGQSYYERDIIALHFTEQASWSQERPKILIQCLLHSREWISGAVCMYIARYLANPNPSDQMLIDLLKRVEFVMIPVANPDGYYLTWLQYPKYRLWRKNVQPFDDTQCAGVDLNRNFNTYWGKEGSSSEPCSELYQGLAPGSEREVQAITGLVRDNAPVYGAIDFHSYQQKVLYPPAGSTKDPEHVTTLDYISQWMASAASQVGVEYTAHKMIDIYTASGTFADWFLEESKGDHTHCPIPMTVELRPQLNDPDHIDAGFLLPTDQILPACQEMLPAVVKFTQLTLQAAPKCTALAA